MSASTDRWTSRVLDEVAAVDTHTFTASSLRGAHLFGGPSPYRRTTTPPPAPTQFSSHHQAAAGEQHRSASQPSSNVSHAQSFAAGPDASSVAAASATAMLLDCSMLEAQLRLKYDHKIRVVAHAIIRSLTEELPHDHILMQLHSDKHTADFAKLRISEVVEMSLTTTLAAQYNSLLAELSRKEVEVMYLRGKLDESITAAATQAGLHASDSRHAAHDIADSASDAELNCEELHASAQPHHNNDNGGSSISNRSRENAAAAAAAAASGRRHRKGGSGGDRWHRRGRSGSLSSDAAEELEQLRSQLLHSREEADEQRRVVLTLEETLASQEEQLQRTAARVSELEADLHRARAAVDDARAGHQAELTAHEEEAKLLREQLAGSRRLTSSVVTQALVPHECKAKERAIAALAGRIVRAFETHSQRPHDLVEDVTLLGLSATSSALALFAERSRATDALLAAIEADGMAGGAGSATVGSPSRSCLQRGAIGDAVVDRSASSASASVGGGDGGSSSLEPLWSVAEWRVVAHGNAKDGANFEFLSQQLQDHRPALADAVADVRHGLKLLKAASKATEELEERMRVRDAEADAAANARVGELEHQLAEQRRTADAELRRERERYDQLHEAHQLVLAGAQREDDAALTNAIASECAARTTAQVSATEATLRACFSDLAAAVRDADQRTQQQARVVEGPLLAVEAKLDAALARAEAQAAASAEFLEGGAAQAIAELLVGRLGEWRAEITEAAKQNGSGVARAAAAAELSEVRKTLSEMQHDVDTARAAACGAQSILSSFRAPSAPVPLREVVEALVAALRESHRDCEHLRHRLADARRAAGSVLRRELPALRRQLAGVRQHAQQHFAAAARQTAADLGALDRTLVAAATETDDAARRVLLAITESVCRAAVDAAAGAGADEGDVGASSAGALRAKGVLEGATGRLMRARSLAEMSEVVRVAVCDAMNVWASLAAASSRRLEALIAAHQQEAGKVVTELRAARASVDVAQAAADSQMEKARALMRQSGAEAQATADAKLIAAMGALLDEKADAERDAVRLRAQVAELKALLSAHDGSGGETEVTQLREKVAALTRQLIAQEKRNGALHERCSAKEQENVRLNAIVRQQQQQQQQQHSSATLSSTTPQSHSSFSSFTPSAYTQRSATTVGSPQPTGVPSTATAVAGGAPLLRGASQRSDAHSATNASTRSDRDSGALAQHTSTPGSAERAAATALGSFFIASGSRSSAREQQDPSPRSSLGGYLSRGSSRRRSPTSGSTGDGSRGRGGGITDKSSSPSHSQSPQRSGGAAAAPAAALRDSTALPSFGGALHFDSGVSDEFAASPSIAFVGSPGR